MTSLMLAVSLPSFIDVNFPPGSHGTYLEQDVPLIFVSQNETQVPAGTIIDKQVSVLDIIPTINALNGWSHQQTFEGRSLVPLLEKQAI